MKRAIVRAAMVMSTIALVACPAESKIPLNVLYLGRTTDATRTEAFSQFLSEQFASCRVEKRIDFEPEQLEGIDVVLIDWPQSERITNRDGSPVGPLQDWNKPTVFLGSAGLLMAQAWQVIGDAG